MFTAKTTSKILFKHLIRSTSTPGRVFRSGKAMMSSSSMKGCLGENGNCYISEVPIPNISQSDLLIKVAATAINRADTLQASGKYPPPKGVTNVLGLEAAGVVVKVGPNAKKGFSEKDEVMCLLAGGGNAEFVAVNENLVMKVPKGLSLKQAAGIPETWITAFQLLFFVARIEELLEKDEENDGERTVNVLVHAAASGVGTALIQLLNLQKKLLAENDVNNVKVVIIGTTSEGKIDKCKELGADFCFDRKSTEKPWDDEVMKATQGKGVDIILDCIGHPYVPKNLKTAAIDCRWALYGLMGGGFNDATLQLNLGVMLGKRIQLLPSTLRTRSLAYKTKLVESFTSKALPHFETGFLWPVIDEKEFSLGEINEAHKYMLGNDSIGKIILNVSSL